jgi:hypothetical protein
MTFTTTHLRGNMIAHDYDIDTKDEDVNVESDVSYIVSPADCGEDETVQESSVFKSSVVTEALRVARDMSQKSSVKFLTYRKEESYLEVEITPLTRTD